MEMEYQPINYHGSEKRLRSIFLEYFQAIVNLKKNSNE